MAEANQTSSAASAQPAAAEQNEFESLLKKEFKPKTDHAMEAIRAGVKTLAEQALADTALVSDDAVKTIESIIAAIDEKLTTQINAILHHPDFKALEGSWR